MKYACIDVGLKRIGLALCLDEKIVMPQIAILRKNRKQASNAVKKFIIDWKIETLIVGLPKDGSSAEEMERRIKHFVSLIDTDINIIYQDEQGSSFEAKEIMKGEIKHKRDGRLDSIASKIILERFLDRVN